MHRSMRKVLVACVCAAATAAVVLHELPEGRAIADPHASRPDEVQSISLEGRDLPVAALRSVLVTHTGDQLAPAKLAADRAALQSALIASGHLGAKVQPAQVLHDAAGGAYITFALTPGPLFHVRDVQVTGAPASETGIMTINRGDVVRADRLEHARDALTTRLASRGKPHQLSVRLVPDALTSTADVVLAAN